MGLFTPTSVAGCLRKPRELWDTSPRLPRLDFDVTGAGPRPADAEPSAEAEHPWCADACPIALARQACRLGDCVCGRCERGLAPYCYNCQSFQCNSFAERLRVRLACGHTPRRPSAQHPLLPPLRRSTLATEAPFDSATPRRRR